MSRSHSPPPVARWLVHLTAPSEDRDEILGDLHEVWMRTRGAIGIGIAVAAGRAMSSVLFEVTGTDPLTLGSVTLLLAGFAVAAAYFPARRASQLAPTVALRDE